MLCLLLHNRMHEVPVEISPSLRMKSSTQDVQNFLHWSPLRLFIDSKVRMSLCSFNHALQPFSRSETILYTIKSWYV